MKCNNCLNEIEQNSIYCKYCGIKNESINEENEIKSSVNDKTENIPGAIVNDQVNPSMNTRLSSNTYQSMKQQSNSVLEKMGELNNPSSNNQNTYSSPNQENLNGYQSMKQQSNSILEKMGGLNNASSNNQNTYSSPNQENLNGYQSMKQQNVSGYQSMNQQNLNGYQSMHQQNTSNVEKNDYNQNENFVTNDSLNPRMENTVANNQGYKPLYRRNNSYQKVTKQVVAQHPHQNKKFYRNPLLIGITLVLLFTSIYLSSKMVAPKQELSEFNGTINEVVMQENNHLSGYVTSDESGIYIAYENRLYKYDFKFENYEVVLNEYVENISIFDGILYYCDENNDYYSYDLNSFESNKLLENVYYVQNLGETIYYQEDSDNESIYQYIISSKEKLKLNDEVSYNLTFFNNKIFYTDSYEELKTLDLDTKEITVLQSGVFSYIIQDHHIYMNKRSGIVKYDIDTKKSENVFNDGNIQSIHTYQNKILCSGNNGLFTISEDESIEITPNVVEDVAVIGNYILYRDYITNQMMVSDGKITVEIMEKDMSHSAYKQNVLPFIKEIEEGYTV